MGRLCLNWVPFLFFVLEVNERVEKKVVFN